MKYSPIYIYVLALIAVYVIGMANADAGALDETRCCVTPERLADGSIKRRADVLVVFKKLYPCPSTGLSTGACKGWAIDHVIPLQIGGRDVVTNLQWLPLKLKSCAVICKDRFEHKIYGKPQVLVK